VLKLSSSALAIANRIGGPGWEGRMQITRVFSLVTAMALAAATPALADPTLDGQLCAAASSDTPKPEEIVALVKQGAALGDVCGGESPLHLAARAAILPNMYALLQSGADANLPDAKRGSRPLSSVHSARAAQLLITYKADVNARDNERNTPLIDNSADAFSVNYSGVEAANIASVLLANGADVNATNADGETALTEAVAMDGLQPLVAVLLDHGADLKNSLARAIQLEKNSRLMNESPQSALDYERLIRAHGGVE
jgi:ankyrin repeat protein